MSENHKTVLWLSLLIGLIVTCGLVPDWIQYGRFFVAGDFANQQIPFIIETKRMLASGAPWWSWNTWFGENFIAGYSFYTLTSPFVWLNCLFPYEQIPTSITLTLYLKFLCTAWLSYAYFCKMSVSRRMSLVGGLLYTFSSFTISNLTYYHFFEPLMCFPILLIAIERFLRREHYGATGLMATSFLTAFINWYFVPCSMLAAAIYTFCRMLSEEITITWKRAAFGATVVLAGILMSSAILFPTICHMAGSQRADAKFSMSLSSWEILLWLNRLRSMVFPDATEGANPLLWNSIANQSNEAYIPIVGILPAIIYVMKYRKDWLSVLVVVSSIAYVTPLTAVFSLFTNPYYSRWAYALVLFLVLAAVKLLDSGIIIRKSHFLAYVFFVGGICLLSYFPVFYNLYKGVWGFSLGDLSLNAILLSLTLLSLFFLYRCMKHSSFRLLVGLIACFSALHLFSSILLRTDWFYAFTDNKEKKSVIMQSILRNDLPRGNTEFQSRMDVRRNDGVSISIWHCLRTVLLFQPTTLPEGALQRT